MTSMTQSMIANGPTNTFLTKPTATFAPHLNQQPPKPPERSCSFKDVDNLQQQQQQLQQALIEFQILNGNTQPVNKRQRSFTNKDSTAFNCLKDLQPNLNSLNIISSASSNQIAPVQTNQTNIRPKSRVFSPNNGTNSTADDAGDQHQSTTIKITSMKLNDSVIQPPNSGASSSAKLNPHKFGTIPSSHKLAAMAAKSSHEKQSSEQQQQQQQQPNEQIPEFQRVFGLLRKVSKQNSFSNSNPSSASSSSSDQTTENASSNSSDLSTSAIETSSDAKPTSRPRLFPKTLPSMQSNSNSKQQAQPASNEAPQPQQRRSHSVSELDVDNNPSHDKETTPAAAINQTNPMTRSQIGDNDASVQAQQTPKFPYSNKPSKGNGGFERLSASRSSATNLFPTGLSLSTSTQNNLRSSFNSHQSYAQQQQQQQNGVKVNGNSTIEYASFNIKPSQYKQTGIFLPINNNNNNNSAQSSNGQKPIGFTANNKQQANLIRQIKEDLELLIQKLRYLQKNRASSPLTPNMIGSTVSLEQFLSLAEDFNEKCTQQLNLIGLLSNESTNSNSMGIQEYQSQLRQLQSSIKQTCAGIQRIDGNSESSSVQDASLSQLSKFLNEFMQCLDRLNNLINNSTQSLQK